MLQIVSVLSVFFIVVSILMFCLKTHPSMRVPVIHNATVATHSTSVTTSLPVHRVNRTVFQGGLSSRAVCVPGRSLDCVPGRNVPGRTVFQSGLCSRAVTGLSSRAECSRPDCSRADCVPGRSSAVDVDEAEDGATRSVLHDRVRLQRVVHLRTRHQVVARSLSHIVSQTLTAMTDVNSSDLLSNRHHRSCGDCLEGKGENYQVCSVQYCVQQLCTVRCTHI